MGDPKSGPISKRTWDFLKALANVNPEEGVLCQNFTVSDTANEAMRQIIKDRMIFGEKKDPESNETDARELTEEARQASQELTQLCDRPSRVIAERIEPNAFQLLTILRARDIAQEKESNRQRNQRMDTAFENILSILEKLRTGKTKLAGSLPETKVAQFFRALAEDKDPLDHYYIPIQLGHVCRLRPNSQVNDCDPEILELDEWLNTPGNVRPTGKNR